MSSAENPEAERGATAGLPAQDPRERQVPLAYEPTVLAQPPADPLADAPGEVAQASPVQADPAQASPVQADPAQASPVQADPAQASPAQAESPTPGTLPCESPSTVGPHTVAPHTDAPHTDAPHSDAPSADAAATSPRAEPADVRPADVRPADVRPADVRPAAPAGVGPVAEDVDRTLDALTALRSRIGDLAEAAAELTRLRLRDTDLIARLHDDVTRLRNGEIASALNPVVTGMIKLHDQMVSLGALADPASPVGMLHTQLLQVLELTCAVKPFTPAQGERFDASRHMGMKRIPTTDPATDGTVAGTLKVGFARADGSVVRVAEVEVHRLSG